MLKRLAALTALCLAPVFGQVPTLVQSYTGSMIASSGSVTSYNIHLPNGAQAGNAIIISGTYTSGSSISSITDNHSNTWNVGKTQTDSGNGIKLSIYFALNVAAGTRDITVNLSAESQYVVFVAYEFANVAAVSALDGSAGHNASGTASVTAGSFTPTTSGDLVLQAAFQDGSSDLTGFIKGSQSNISWELASANTTSFFGAQWGVYNSTAALNPTMSMSQPEAYVSAAIALKAGASGSVPSSSGIRITHIQHEFDNGSNAGVLQFPCTGNLVVIAFVSGSNVGGRISSVSSSPANTWTKIGETEQSNASYVSMWYAPNASTSTDMTVTETFEDAASQPADASQATSMLYCIAGADAAPLDTHQVGDGEVVTNGGNLTTVTLTPSTPNGLVIGEVGVYSNTVTGTVGTGYMIDSSTYGGESESGPDDLDENNGWAHIYNSDTSPVTFTYTPVTQSVAWNAWDAMATAFKGAAPAPPSVFAKAPVVLFLPLIH